MPRGCRIRFKPRYEQSHVLNPPDGVTARVLKADCKTPADFLRAEAQGSRIRQRNEPDYGDLTQSKLKARITLPTVKGYWE
jgi:hypothetical protein